MFRQRTTTVHTYHLSKKDFKTVCEIFCKWTNNSHDSIKNDFTADGLFKMRKEFFQAVTKHLAETQKSLDSITQKDEAAKRAVKALIDKTIQLEEDCHKFDELTDYDDLIVRTN